MPSTNTYIAASSKLYEWAFGMPSGNASGPVLRRWKTTAVIIVADIASAVGRENTPRDSRTAPAIWVPAADKVQNCGGPGRKPKNLATTLAEKPSTFWILSKPWWTMRAQGGDAHVGESSDKLGLLSVLERTHGHDRPRTGDDGGLRGCAGEQQSGARGSESGEKHGTEHRSTVEGA